MLPCIPTVWVHPIPGQQKSLMLGIVNAAVGQEEWGKFLKRIDGIISQGQLKRGIFR